MARIPAPLPAALLAIIAGSTTAAAQTYPGPSQRIEPMGPLQSIQPAQPMAPIPGVPLPGPPTTAPGDSGLNATRTPQARSSGGSSPTLSEPTAGGSDSERNSAPVDSPPPR